jgi:divalent metal cation (Fe/Co/Zn/Cd) transporter
VDAGVSRFVKQGDVVVHVDPVRRSDESLTQSVSAIAARLGLRTHFVHAHEVRGRRFLDLHVEVPPDLTLRQAHELVSRLELAVRQEVPQVSDVHSHIEPAATPAIPVGEPGPSDEAELREQVAAILKEIPELRWTNRQHLRPGPDGLDVVLHCLADPDLPITEAHRLADRLEKQVQARFPGMSRVLVHVEPEGEG